jgi:hypothetical protein
MGCTQLPSSQWHQTVTPAVLARVGKQEMRRQEAIHEFVQSEENYVHDMDLVVRVCQTPNPISTYIQTQRQQPQPQ